MSSTKAEYRGIFVASGEVSFLRNLLDDLWIQVDRKIVIYYDNLSSVQLARNPMLHARTKHIDVHYNSSKEQILASDIDLAYVNTEEHVVDIFTKALGDEKLY